SCNNVADCLEGLGRYDEAPPLYQKALRIWEGALGKEHPDTANGYNNVASCLEGLGRRAEALRLFQQSLRGQEAARVLRAASGFDRAQQARGISPREALAVGLAALRQPRNAFAHAEASLARGLLDDLAGPSSQEKARADELRTRLAKLEPAL